jgi:hypothetical protein
MRIQVIRVNVRNSESMRIPVIAIAVLVLIAWALRQR